MQKNIVDGFLYLPRQDIVTVCEQLDSVAIIREVFRLHATGQTILPDEAYLGWENSVGERVRSLNMPAYVGGELRYAGTKIINGNIANPTRGLPRASGLTLLYDDTSVRVQCVMESAYISSLRTASVSILATQLLQGPPIECVAVIGAGVIAQMHIALLLKHIPTLRTIRIYDLDAQRIVQLDASLAEQFAAREVTLYSATSAEDAIRPAQCIIPATTTTTGYIEYSWLQPGAIVINVSLDDVLPEVVARAACVIVDDWMLVKNDTHRLIGRMYREGTVIGPDDPSPLPERPHRRIDAQLGDLITGHASGRRTMHDIILVNPFGLAIEDVALAAHIYESARKLGLGQFLPY